MTPDASLRVVSLLTDAVNARFSATGNGVHVDTASVAMRIVTWSFVVGSKTVPYPTDRS
jgi:hypothetical protein